MKPLPDLADTEAMLRQGRMSALHQARKEAQETLRDACTMCQSADWDQLSSHARVAASAADRLVTLAAVRGELE